MADRVKYFVLGLLFLVVAGVIAFDKWNGPQDNRQTLADRKGEQRDRFDLIVGPDSGDQERDQDPDHARDRDEETDPGGGREMDDTDARAREHQAMLRRIEAEKKAAAARAKKNRVTPKPNVKPTPKVESKIHIVRSGDSLEKIAMKYYKSRNGIDLIVAANKLRNRNRIFANQKLIIPAVKSDGRTPTVIPVRGDLKKTPRKIPNKIPSTYTVKASDGDLYAICRKFYGSKGEGARVSRIMALNGLWSATVKTGSVLQLPPK